MDWSHYAFDHTGCLYFVVLPLGLLITTHLAFFELRFRYYAFGKALLLALLPYVVLWASIDIVSMINYVPEPLFLIPLGAALLVFFILGPVFCKYMVHRLLKCTDDEAIRFFIHWTVANVIFGFLFALALPNY